MKYTVEFVLDIDGDKICEDKELEGIVNDCLDNTSITVRDFKVISIDN